MRTNSAVSWPFVAVVSFAAIVELSGMIVLAKISRDIQLPLEWFVAPSKDREREYVTGGNKKSGGIQRFKLGLHGAHQEQAAILAYIQSGLPDAWLTQVNAWIDAETTTPSASGERWTSDEKLINFAEDSVRRTGQASSEHARDNSISDKILIKHLWIVM